MNTRTCPRCNTNEPDGTYIDINNQETLVACFECGWYDHAYRN